MERLHETELDHVKIQWLEKRRGDDGNKDDRVWDIFDRYFKNIDPNYDPSYEDFKDIVDTNRIINIIGISWENGYEHLIPRALECFARYFNSTSRNTAIVSNMVSEELEDFDDEEEYVSISEKDICPIISKDNISIKDIEQYELSNHFSLLKDGEIVNPIYFDDGPRYKFTLSNDDVVYVSAIKLFYNVFDPDMIKDKNPKIEDFNNRSKIIEDAFNKAGFKHCEPDEHFNYNCIIGALSDNFIAILKEFKECI